MLVKFEVENFKNFQERFVIDLGNTKNYEFNTECVASSVVKTGLIYGPNASGKSNLGFAILELIEHLTDKKFRNLESIGKNFLNANSKSKHAEFMYFFKFDNDSVKYSFRKDEDRDLIFEELIINNKVVLFIDRSINNHATFKFSGAESLNRDLGDSRISAVKYLKSNSVLDSEDKNNQTFSKFFDFINKMEYFRSIKNIQSIGEENPISQIGRKIIERDLLEDFEGFLNKAGIKCKLSSVMLNEKLNIAFNFGKRKIQFTEIASTGTYSLALFYYWLKRMEDSEVSFLYFDEFDAYYHAKLSEEIINRLKKIGCQTLTTTHNTSIMSNELLRPDCYFLMENNKINPFFDITEKEIRQAHNLEKIYRSTF